MITDGQVVILDGGTTAIEVARALRPDLRATIVTHSPSTAVELVRYPDIEVMLIGGRLFKHSIVTTGADAMEAIRRVRADLYFLGVTGIHPESGLTMGDYDEAGIKQALMAQAAETIALGSKDKIGTAAPYMVAPVRALAGIVMEASADPGFVEAVESLGVSVTRA